MWPGRALPSLKDRVGLDGRERISGMGQTLPGSRREEFFSLNRFQLENLMTEVAESHHGEKKKRRPN